MSQFHGWDKVRNDKRGWTDFEAPSNRSKIRAQDDGTIVLRGDFDRLNEAEQKGLKYVFKAVLEVVDPPKETATEDTPAGGSITTVPATGNKKNMGGNSGIPSEIPTDTK